MTTNPFLAAGRIEKLHLFQGYNHELNDIVNSMTGAQPTSLNVYGERRIGKSSLLYHFYLTWQQRIDLNLRDKFAVIYLSLQESHCKNECQFYQALAQELSTLYLFQRRNDIQNIWQDREWTREKFSDAIRLCKRFNILPVLCLDDVETALKNDKAFDGGFYDNLRALMGSNALMLVIATFKPVNRYKKEYGLSSLFFNQGHNIPLKGFSEKTINEFMRVADSVGMSENEQALICRWGGNNPYRLQLAGFFLFEAKRQEKDEQWAKRKFDEQLDFLKSSSQSILLEKSGSFLSTLGNIAEKVAEFINEWRTKIGGILIVVVIILYLLDAISIKHLIAGLMSIFAISF